MHMQVHPPEHPFHSNPCRDPALGPKSNKNETSKRNSTVRLLFDHSVLERPLAIEDLSEIR